MDTDATDEAGERIERMQRRAAAGMQALQGNDDFAAVWDLLEWQYPLVGPSFVAGHEGNTHLAAIRDGQKDVMRTLHALRSMPSDRDYELGDAQAKPTHATTESPR